jgi:hypothetical protein
MGGRVQIHRELAERLAERYMNDARQMDKAFFGGRELLASALAAAADDCPAEQQVYDLRQRFDDRDRADLNRAIAELVSRVREFGPMWQSVYRADLGHALRSNGKRPDPGDQKVREQARDVDAAIAAVVTAGVGLYHPSPT